MSQTELTEDQRIQLEARQAAEKYTDINAACPYPWGSPQATIFKREFIAANHIPWPFPDGPNNKTTGSLSGLQVDELPFENSEFEHLCVCGMNPTLDEFDRRKCGSCGKEIVL